MSDLRTKVIRTVVTYILINSSSVTNTNSLTVYGIIATNNVIIKFGLILTGNMIVQCADFS